MNKMFATLATIAMSILSQAVLAQPQYNIISLGQPGESQSGGQGVSSSGNFATGFTNSSPLLWSDVSGTSVLPGVPGRPFSSPQSVNDAGTIVGIGTTTFFGSGALPVMWKNGAVVLLPLPAGETLGRARSVNNNELAVGSVDGGSAERAATFTATIGTELTETMSDGGVLTTAYGVNDTGRIVGQALDPNNAAVTRGFYLDPGAASATDIGALTAMGHNSAIAFAVSSNGLVAGSSSLNSGANGMAFVWSEAGGMTPIPLPAGTSTASARGVNADGWAVGTGGGLFAIPFLYDGTNTFRLHDLLPAGSGWDLETGTSNGAFGIADDGTIVGRGMLNGNLTGFVMTRVPEPSSLALLFIGLLAAFRHR